MGGIQSDNDMLQQWWQQCLNNDTGAFAAIHEALFEGLYNYAAKLLDDEDLADDAIQDLFIKIWNKRFSIGSLRKVKPFFYTTLRRQVLNQLRDSKVRHIKISMTAEPAIEFSQEEIFIQKEADAGLKEKIISLLNSLPERQRELIYLHYFENLTITQIAEIMNINQQSAMNIKQRALQKMRSVNLLHLFLLLCTICHPGNF
ncbi:MAG: sigma-70 family RNA polymerase sigma factor [Ferruginibacter sp.]